MKNRAYNNILALLVNCFFFLAFIACSESSTAGGTVDDNSIAEVSVDEKAILEHHVDSTKVFAEAGFADIDDTRIDSTVYWFEVDFRGKKDNYFVHEEEKLFSYCYVDVYQLDFGVRTIKYIPIGDNYTRTFFLTADEQGIVYHEKLDNDYDDDIARCEKDLSDFEQNCENGGGSLYSHKADCAENSLHLTCSTSKGRLMTNAETLLNNYAENMKNWCLENR